MKNALKNCVMFFGAATVGMVAFFLFLSIFINVPQAHAYAVGSALPGSGVGSNAAGNYDAGNSFQNLISPFTGFINSLKFNNNTTIGPNGMNPTAWPTVNLTPVVESSFQNLLSQWLNEFDNWFYGVTGVQLSGIFLVLLNLFSWALGLAQQVVNWLLGLFH